MGTLGQDEIPIDGGHDPVEQSVTVDLFVPRFWRYQREFAHAASSRSGA
jgi:hypothetical protein